MKKQYDFVIIGSGFGGSVSALRLLEKGYNVLLIEKGKRYTSKDFPKNNLNLRKWLWLPLMRFYGIFKITLFRHVGVVSGVGYGGGSLVYANTLPIPKKQFYTTGSWAKLEDWETELKPYYSLAEKMLGSTPTPKPGPADLALQKLAISIGKEYDVTKVAVYFGEEGKTVKDPFFNGEGPDRAGCTYCGACMTGCRENAKNTLDKNYLFLAEKKGLDVLTEKEVVDVIPKDSSGSSGYGIVYQDSTSIFKNKDMITSNAIVFAGGVLGSVKLLLKLKKSSLPNLSEKLGNDIRTNNESLIGIINDKNKDDFSKGVAIGSIIHTDENSHLEVVRYGKGSSFWRFTFVPLAYGTTFLKRLGNVLKNTFKKPFRLTKIALQWNFTSKNSILLFMQTLDSTLRFTSDGNGMKSKLQDGPKPSSFIPEAEELAHKYAKGVDGEAFMLSTELLTGSPTTAHILGGCVIGENSNTGVIDKNHNVFNYKNLWIIDGSAVSANPGVNPSLTITAMAERAMKKIPVKLQ